MTTVIWKNGILYADTRISSNLTISKNGTKHPVSYSDNCQKIFKINSIIYGITGDYLTARSFVNILTKKNNFFKKLRLAWFLLGYSLSDKTSNVITWDGSRLCINKLDYKKTFLFLYKVKYNCKIIDNPLKNDTWVTLGSGCNYAAEAIKMGLTPYESIQYASDRDPFTNDEIMTIGLTPRRG